MKQLSREEWIGVSVALVLGIALFIFSFLLMGFRQLTQEAGTSLESDQMMVIDEGDVSAGEENGEAETVAGELEATVEAGVE